MKYSSDRHSSVRQSSMVRIMHLISVSRFFTPKSIVTKSATRCMAYAFLAWFPSKTQPTSKIG
jgi:hypothetical protein